MPVDTEILPPRYHGPKRIGRGGMGDIYRATDETLGRAVAIKVLAPRYAEDEAIRQRFMREALAAARLSGEPNTVTIFDVGEHNEKPFIVMEYLSGGSLDDRISGDGPQPPRLALEWLDEAATALDAAHAQGVVHRDVKPGNLLLDRDGHIHVADFGIASAAGLDSLTITGTVLGTAGYLSPEQAQGKRATPASDVYALGVVAFELLTGERPYRSDSTTAEAAAHVHAPIPSACDRRPELPCELDDVFQRVLAKDPADRYASCREFVDALRDAVARSAGVTEQLAPAPARPTRATVPLASDDGGGPGYLPPRRRSPWPLVLGLALLAALGGVALAFALTSGDDDEPEASPPTVVTTVTARGTTREVTVTAEPPPAPPPPPPPAADAPTASPPPAPPPAGGGDGVALTDQSTELIRQGRYAEALPIAQRALAALEGSGELYEAYANYNVGTSLIHTGNCGAGLPYLDRSEQIQGVRSEIDADRELCERQG